MFSLSAKDWRTIILVVIGQLILVRWALTLVAPPEGISLMWLPDGYMLGMFLVLPRRLWWPLLLVLIPVTLGLEYQTTDRAVSMILGFMAANLVESLGGAWLYSRLADEPRRFTHFRDLLLFLLLCVIALPAVSASIGAYTVVAHGFTNDFWAVYRTWIMSAGLGILFVAPLVLYVSTWLQDYNHQVVRDQLPLFVMVVVAVLLILLPATVLDLGYNADLFGVYLTLPLLILSAIRFGLWGAMLLSSAVVITSVQLTAMDNSPFLDGIVSASQAVMSLQGYLVSIIVASLFTGLAIEKQRAARNQLLSSENRLQLLLDTLPYGIQENSRDGTITYSNSAHHEIMGRDNGELVGKPIWHAELDDSAVERLQGYLKYLVAEKPTPVPYVTQNRKADGSPIWIEVNWDYQLDASGEVNGFISIISDITDRIEADARLRQAAEVFRSTAEGVMITDAETRIIDVNRAFKSITGYREEEVKGRTPDFLQSGRHDEMFYHTMWATINEQGHWRGEIWNRRKNGDIYPELLTISAVLDNDDNISGYVGVFSDITPMKQSQERLEFLAHHDPLTELPNRVLFNDRLIQGIRHAERHGNKLAVIFIDLDRFKNINDTLGHNAGDQLLQQLATRFLAALRQDDSVARISGDEFTVLLGDIGSVDDAINAVTKIMRVFEVPFVIEHHQITTTASIGISLYPDDGADANTLMRNADAAMYRAKAEGRNNYQFYAEEMTAAAFEHLFMENALRTALQKDEFYLVYQPQYDLKSNQMIGFEVLIRWRHPDQGVIPPIRFIPVAEQSGLIRAIGEWVLIAACSQAKQWLDAGLPVGRLAINVAGPQIQHPQFAQRVDEILKQTGFPPQALELEVTESFVMQQGSQGMAHLETFRSKGIRISIDDFGTGYSSLSYLKILPIDKLKIDASFVRDIPDDKNDAAIAEAVIALGHALDLTVIAEGVETEEQVHFLKSRDCWFAQGYWFSPPVEREEMEELLKQQAQAESEAPEVVN